MVHHGMLYFIKELLVSLGSKLNFGTMRPEYTGACQLNGSDRTKLFD